MTDTSRIMELEKEIVKLKCENLNLQEEKNYMEHIIEAPPPNYEEVKILKMRCEVLEKILRYSDISPMPQIIEEYKAMSTYYLQQLMKEIEIYRISSEERSVLMDFLEYLNYVETDIKEMLLVEN